jgi:hypothetical protein
LASIAGDSRKAHRGRYTKKVIEETMVSAMISISKTR